MAHLYTGRDGFMTRGDNVRIAKITAFTMQSDLELLEATSLRDSIKKYVPGLQSFSGTATLLYYNGADGTSEQQGTPLIQSLLKVGQAGITPSEVYTLSLRFENRDNQGLKQVTFQAWITSVSLGVSVGEVASAQISFTARDELSTVVL